MSFSFELLLTLLVVVSGVIALLDMLILKRRRGAAVEMPKYIEYSRSFFPVLFIVLIIRSFVVEPFRIPTGSLEPTLVPGDFIAADKFAYGLRLPVIHTEILKTGEPKLGDIVVFRWPVDTNIDFIKRVVGVPGDTISYVNKVLYINGVEQPQTNVGTATDSDGKGSQWTVDVRSETLNGIKHLIYIRPDFPAQNFTITVPPGHYFMMGDNRDNSEDSRYWGFVPEKDLLGKAFIVWFSWNGNKDSIRWSRVGTLINHNK